MAASCDLNIKVATDLKQLLNEELSPEHLQVLTAFRSSLRDEEVRASVEEETFSVLSRVLIRFRDDLQTSTAADREPQPLLLQLITKCFRCQRNACLHNTRNQDTLRNLGFIDISIQLLNLLLMSSLKSKHEPLICGMQFLVNVAVGNQMSKDYIWKKSNPGLFLQLLNADDVKVVDYASAVLHTCLDEAKLVKLSQPENIQVALRVMEFFRTHPGRKWVPHVVTKHFVKSSSLLGTMYCNMGNLDRLFILELLYDLLKAKSSECQVDPTVGLFLIDSFKTNCGATLKLSTDSLEAQMEIRLVDVLCEMTSDLSSYLYLQNESDLLQTAVELLRQVNVAGELFYSPLQNFHSSDPPVTEFKTKLIRLIANLCSKHADNKNKVRELGGIPHIWENYMSTNLCLSTTAAFAITVLIKQNPQNKEIVDNMERDIFGFSCWVVDDL